MTTRQIRTASRGYGVGRYHRGKDPRVPRDAGLDIVRSRGDLGLPVPAKTGARA